MQAGSLLELGVALDAGWELELGVALDAGTRASNMTSSCPLKSPIPTQKSLSIIHPLARCFANAAERSRQTWRRPSLGLGGGGSSIFLLRSLRTETRRQVGQKLREDCVERKDRKLVQRS